MAKKRFQKTTPEEWARIRENQHRMETVLAKRLERDGTTREEIWRRLGLPNIEPPLAR